MTLRAPIGTGATGAVNSWFKPLHNMDLSELLCEPHLGVLWRSSSLWLFKSHWHVCVHAAAVRSQLGGGVRSGWKAVVTVEYEKRTALATAVSVSQSLWVWWHLFRTLSSVLCCRALTEKRSAAEICGSGWPILK